MELYKNNSDLCDHSPLNIQVEVNICVLLLVGISLTLSKVISNLIIDIFLVNRTS